MEQRITLNLAELQDIEFITDIKTDKTLWEFEYDISSDKEAVKKTVIERINGNRYKQYIIF